MNYILYEACQLSILHDDSIQFNSLEFEDCSDSRVHKVSPICMLVIVYNNFQQPDPNCLAPFKLDTVSRILCLGTRSTRYTCPFVLCTHSFGIHYFTLKSRHLKFRNKLLTFLKSLKNKPSEPS